jgi:hypothetical protein
MSINVDSIVKDVKGKVEPIVVKGQEVVTASFEVLKQANAIVVEGVQGLVKIEVEAGKDLFAAAQTSFGKAKADGFKAVAAAPVEYLPDGKERVISAYNDTVSLVTKTGEELVKVVKTGYETVIAKVSGEPVIVAKAKTTAKAAVKKTTKKVSAAAKKASA